MVRTILAALLTLLLLLLGAILILAGIVYPPEPVRRPIGPRWGAALDNLNEPPAQPDGPDTQATTPGRLQQRLDERRDRSAQIEPRMVTLADVLAEKPPSAAPRTALDRLNELRTEKKERADQLRTEALLRVAAGLLMMGFGVLSGFWFRRRWKATVNRDKQSVIVWVGVLFLVAMCLYPPSTYRSDPYDFLWESAGSIDLKRLFVQMMAVALPVSAVLFALRGQTDPKAPE